MQNKILNRFDFFPSLLDFFSRLIFIHNYMRFWWELNPQPVLQDGHEPEHQASK